MRDYHYGFYQNSVQEPFDIFQIVFLQCRQLVLSPRRAVLPIQGPQVYSLKAHEVGRGKLLYIGWIKNKVLLYSTGNYIQHPVTNHNGKGYEKEYICV